MAECSCSISQCIHTAFSDPGESVRHYCTTPISCPAFLKKAVDPQVARVLAQSQDKLIFSRVLEVARCSPDPDQVFRYLLDNHLVGVTPKPHIRESPQQYPHTRGASARVVQDRWSRQLWASLAPARLGSCLLSTPGYQDCLAQSAEEHHWAQVWQENYLSLQSFVLRAQCLRCRPNWTCDYHSHGPIFLYEMPERWWRHLPEIQDWLQQAYHLLLFRFRSAAWTYAHLSALFPDLRPLNPGNRGPQSCYLLCRLLHRLMREETDEERWLDGAVELVRRKHGVAAAADLRRLTFVRNFFRTTNDRVIL
jgi:hypothetical protein